MAIVDEKRVGGSFDRAHIVGRPINEPLPLRRLESLPPRGTRKHILEGAKDEPGRTFCSRVRSTPRRRNPHLFARSIVRDRQVLERVRGQERSAGPRQRRKRGGRSCPLCGLPATRERQENVAPVGRISLSRRTPGNRRYRPSSLTRGIRPSAYARDTRTRSAWVSPTNGPCVTIGTFCRAPA